MKAYKILLFLAFLLPIQLYSGGNTGKIIVEIEGFPNDKGVVRSHLFNSAEPYPTESDSAFKKTTSFAKSGKAVLEYDNVPYGIYALTVHHDENNNGKMDRNFIGYPKEGFGLSNNPKIMFSVPTFEECKFKLDKDVKIIKIKLKFV